MKQALLRHYGKILLTILALGVGAYFHVDVSKALDAIAHISEAPAPDAGAGGSPDAGQ